MPALVVVFVLFLAVVTDGFILMRSAGKDFVANSSCLVREN